VHVTTKFHDPTFNRSEVVLLTNKQTPLKTSTSLRYATPGAGKHMHGHARFCSSNRLMFANIVTHWSGKSAMGKS